MKAVSREHVEHQRARARLTPEQLILEQLSNLMFHDQMQRLIERGETEKAMRLVGEEMIIDAMTYNGHELDEVMEALR